MKKIIIFTVIFVLLAAMIGIAWEVFSYKKVSVELQGEGYTVEVLNNDKKKVASIDETGEIKLKEGSYNYKIVGENYSTTEETFTVLKDGAQLTINPSYSKEYLNDLLDNENQAISNALTASMPFGTTYTLLNLQLYKKGEWAAGTISPITDPRQVPDIYRFVLQKDNGTWKVIISPQIAINKANYPEVPVEILYGLYSES